MEHEFVKGEVAWLKSSIVGGVPTVAVEIVGMDAFGGINVCKTKEPNSEPFWVKPTDLISGGTAAEMADFALIRLN
jgi:hypothetical protein